MPYCLNCRQEHAVEATEEHQAPCPMCDSDGHARCQHDDRQPVDETPTVCADPECGRTRPRWTMASRIVDGSERFECSPKFAMWCGACCEPGQYLTHYTEEEHRHDA